MLSSKSYVDSVFMFRSMIRNRLSLMYGVRKGAVEFCLFVSCEYSIVPAPFVEKTVLSSLN